MGSFFSAAQVEYVAFSLASPETIGLGELKAGLFEAALSMSHLSHLVPMSNFIQAAENWEPEPWQWPGYLDWAESLPLHFLRPVQPYIVQDDALLSSHRATRALVADMTDSIYILQSKTQFLRPLFTDPSARDFLQEEENDWKECCLQNGGESWGQQMATRFGCDEKGDELGSPQ